MLVSQANQKIKKSFPLKPCESLHDQRFSILMQCVAAECSIRVPQSAALSSIEIYPKPLFSRIFLPNVCLNLQKHQRTGLGGVHFCKLLPNQIISLLVNQLISVSYFCQLFFFAYQLLRAVLYQFSSFWPDLIFSTILFWF